jgi:predicted alpha/beta superfamily hydrolase
VKNNTQKNFFTQTMALFFVFCLLICLVSSGCIPAEHTIVGNVTIIEDFNMPELERTRDIWIYVPPDYQDNTSKHYPVLYMQDGQNLFDVITSSTGEWGIDETLEDFFENGETDGVIVVGIENGGAQRTQEYSPWEFQLDNEILGGEGDEFVDFIVNTLKPHIDVNYRTLPNRENTGIVGSSMGGLISLYAGIKYQRIFSKVCAMSSSFWMGYVNMMSFLASNPKKDNMRIYLDAGELEGQDMVDNTNGVYDKLLEIGFSQDELMKVLDEDGEHNEAFWRERFPNAFLWLLSNAMQ